MQSFSGIRGLWQKDLTEEVVSKYAYCFLSLLRKAKKNPVVVIGSDTRPSRNAIKDSLYKIFDKVIDIGIAPTPAIELAVRTFKADGGIIITASHNEPEYNGLKFLDSTGAILSPKVCSALIEDYQKVKDLGTEDFDKKFTYDTTVMGPFKEKQVEKKNKEALNHYADFIQKLVGKKGIEQITNAKYTMLIDPNGGAGVVAKPIIEKLGVKTITINEVIGEFNRKIEPNKDSLAYLKPLIKTYKADFAAGFDCDADRVEMVLPNGKLISGQYILALVVDEILSSSSSKGKTVVTNDVTSGVVSEIAKSYKAKIKEVEVGEANVVSAMRKLKSPVGGEGSSSGAIVPPSTCRDGILTLAFILRLMAKQKKPLENIINKYPVYYTERTNVTIDPSKHDTLKKNIKSYFKKQKRTIQETGDITGGLKIIFPENAFLWFRASKTEPNLMRIIADANNRTKAKKLLKKGTSFFKK